MLGAVAALTIAAVLDQASAYVSQLERQLSRIVAEERYVQTSIPGGSRDCAGSGTPGPCAGDSPPKNTVQLHSDLMIVRSLEANDWAEYRDVYEVDGQPVRDRTDRLTALVRAPTASARKQLADIVATSARYNIGEIVRTVNTPLFALKILEAANQPRFKFKVSKDAIPTTVAHEPTTPGAFRTTTEVWVIEYQEQSRPTMIRTPDRKDLPARGRFWIEPETGRVLMSEIVAENHTVRGIIDVSYQSEPVMGLLVPVEMREWYDGKGTRAHVEAVATYGRFRPITE
jgi:hypothetical protein